jgi:hypothetical protein
MAGVMLPDMRPWGRRPLTIPPDSRSAWIQLAIWEIWIGGLIAMTCGFGALFLTAAPARVLTRLDLTACYGPPPVPNPCAQTIYLGGALNAAFTALIGLLLIGVGIWFIFELWCAVAPKPLTDDFLTLLHDSFGRDWRNPLKWPWRRLGYAYGFAAIGGAATLALAITAWNAAAASTRVKVHTIHVETSEGFRRHGTVSPEP